MRTLIDNGNAPAKRQPLIGHYGHLRKAYLEQFDPGLYTALLASEKLYEHCAEINEACRSRIDLIMPQLAGSAGATEKLKAAEATAGEEPLLELLPYVKKTAAIVATGSEVKKGLIQDTFTPVVKAKLAAYGIETISTAYSGDGVENVANAIGEARKTGADLILCTGGMSVDPDDNTPGGIRASGARIVTYGAPVLPGAMFLLGYFEDGTPICGLPGCVMYAGATIFDLALPRIAAGVELTRRDFAVMGEGGLCLGCKPCHWPNCPFGK